jgi:sporulation protein YlmC with PRC-barrel domain
MCTRILVTMLVAFGATLAISEFAVAQDKGAKIQVATTFRSSHVIGMPVRNNAGKDLGTIKDLIVDLNSGDTRYAVLSFGGFAGFGSKLFAIPWQVLSVKFGEKDHFFVYDVTEEQLKQAPGFDDNTWPNLGDPEWAASVEKHYRIQPAEKKAGQNVAYVTLYRVSTIKGVKVRNNANEDLGFIYEVVLNLKEGKIRYAALSFGSIAGLGGKLFAIPFDAFVLKHEGNDKHFVLDMSAEKLKAAPGFDSNHWPDMADPDWARDIDRYYENVRSAQRTTTRKD